MAARRQEERSNTRSSILDIAEPLLQDRGFNGFSYADVAAELGVSTAALHYHFRGKGELGKALVTRYAERFSGSLRRIGATDERAPAKLRAYADLYLAALRGHRMCLCGMLAAEYQTLPQPMRITVIRFFDENHRWLAGILEAGRAEGSLSYRGSAGDAAQMIVGAVEGAMLVSRPYRDTARFETVAEQLLATITSDLGGVGMPNRWPR